MFYKKKTVLISSLVPSVSRLSLQNHQLVFSLKTSLRPSECRPLVVLEIGSGPLTTGLVSASARADLLLYSDLLEVNLAEISSSLRGQTAPASDQPSLEFIASLERCSVRRLWERLVRSPAVLLRSDILSGPVVSPDVLLPAPPTVIITKLCLEFALHHQGQLHSALQRICSVLGRLSEIFRHNLLSLNYLGRNGFLVLMGALGESHYYVGEARFPAISLSREILEEAVRSTADLELVSWRQRQRLSDKLTKPTGHSAVYFLCARKR